MNQQQQTSMSAIVFEHETPVARIVASTWSSSTRPPSSINPSSPKSAASHFERVMSQPCLVILFQFFTLDERLTRQSVSHAWMEMARLSRFWANYQYDFPTPLYHVHPIVTDGRAPSPEWLCHALGGLKVYFPEFVWPCTFHQLRELFYSANLVHLELSAGEDDDDQLDETITLEQGREALKQLRLRSFTCINYRSRSLVTDILFGTADEIASIVVASLQAPASSSTTTSSPSLAAASSTALFISAAESNRHPRKANAKTKKPSVIPESGPVILGWHQTLEQLTIASDRSARVFFQVLSQVTWPALTHFNWSQEFAPVDFDTSSLNGLRQLLTSRTLPNLYALQFEVHPEHVSSDEVTAIVTHALSHYFHSTLQELRVDLTHFNASDPDGETFVGLKGSPPFEYCFHGLTTIVIAEGFTVNWLKAISECHHLTHLSIQSMIHTDVTEFDFFEAISSLCISELELSFFRSTSSHEDDATIRLRGYLSRMRSLTKLSLSGLKLNFKFSQSGLQLYFPSEVNSWLGYLDNLPSLTTFSSCFKFDRNPSLMPWHEDPDEIATKKTPGKYPTKMLDSLAHSSTLTSLTLGTLGVQDLQVFNEVWLGRIKDTPSRAEVRPILLRQLKLNDLVLTDSFVPHLVQLVGVLSRLPFLSDLTIAVVHGGYRPGSAGNLVFKDLDRCRSLRTLRLKSHYSFINNDILRQWCRNQNEELQLESSVASVPKDEPNHGEDEDEDDDDASSSSRVVVVDGSSTQFPQLELLELDIAGVSPPLFELLYALPRLRHLHWTGHRPVSEVWKRIEDRNRRCIQMSMTGTGRPPLHIGSHVRTKLDRIQPMKVDKRQF